MKYSKALHIIDNINSGEFSNEEKALAIYELTKDEYAPNSIRKDDLLKVIKYLFNECYDVEEVLRCNN